MGVQGRTLVQAWSGTVNGSRQHTVDLLSPEFNLERQIDPWQVHQSSKDAAWNQEGKAVSRGMAEV